MRGFPLQEKEAAEAARDDLDDPPPYRPRKRSGEELSAIRAQVVQEWGERSFTCDRCQARHTCEFAFDLYNTDGDCLAEK
jgi:hypothetical protein